MNAYDSAHSLARSLSSSEEYRALLAAKTALAADDAARKMVRDFLGRQMELQMEGMSGKGEDKAKAEQLQRLYDTILYNPPARDFLHAHMRLQRMLADIYKIVGDSVSEGLDFLVKE